MKQFTLSLIFTLMPLLASADSVEIDGIWYNLRVNLLVSNAKQAEVLKKTSGYYSGAIVIPEKVIYNGTEYSVTSIGEYAFSDCSGLTSVTIPNSVTSIGYYAFYNCTGLTSVHISDLEAWCKISFNSGSDANPLSYAHHLYINGSEITNLVIPNSVTSIGDYAFYNCSTLTSITIGNSVTSIGEHAFQRCYGLTSITIPNSVTSIGKYAFSSCSGLTSVTIPNSVTSIGIRAFQSCSGLTSITISNSVTSIGNFAFDGCTGLTSVTIPNSVTSIGKCAFSSCSGLTSVTIPNSVTSIGDDAFRYCSGLTSITIGNSVKSIGEWAFFDCRGLTSITIPNSVTSIGAGAFGACSGLTSIIIGSGITGIGESAFANCPELTDVTCMAEELFSTDNGGSSPLYTETSAFEDSYIDAATLHVPESAINAYKTTAPWSGFGKFEALTDKGQKVPGDANGDNFVNAADIVEVVNAMNGHPSANYNEGNADMDGNGKVTKDDIEAIVKIILE